MGRRDLTSSTPRDSRARVLVLSMFLAPCKEVGGKRFTYLSPHLAAACGDYHVLARREKVALGDTAAFDGKVHRVRMLPHYPPTRIRGTLHSKLIQAWIRWFCVVEPYIGWVVPAIVKGV